MATAQLGAVLRHIRGLAADPKVGEPSDGALLRAFLGRNDQSAFEALLRRHGPMVLRVCRRTLGHVHDADDAFQATFLVLARQASSIRKRASLASWLYGVAYRMATHAKRAAARRRGHESRAKPPQPRDPALSAAWQELQALLDEEIAGLPEALRAPFVCCCLEDQSCAAAAQRLGLKEATVWKRLSRARKLLRERLTRRGLALTAVLAAAAVGAGGARAAVPRGLVGPTVQAAAQTIAGRALAGCPVSARVLSLVEGVNQAMFLSKCKTALLLLVCTATAPVAILRRRPGPFLPAGHHRQGRAVPDQGHRPRAGRGLHGGGADH
jgi:RNA polymerase sigma factor (sigma-70 family)